MKLRKLNTILFIVIVLLMCESTHTEDSTSTCTMYKTCAECIQSKDNCAFCLSPESTFGNQTKTRCNSQEYYAGETNRCSKALLINPKNSVDLTKNEDISIGSGSAAAVQIKPQQVALKLRVGQAQHLKVEFAQAKDFPVDLYYLMDLSNSMKDDKENVNKFGEQLAKQMTDVTSKFKIGFGSFVDKVVMPFVSTVDAKLQHPCGDTEECVTPYSFKNHLKLTSEFSRFTVEVNNSKVSGNLDGPEGGFDGLVQVAVCDDAIGWRKDARKFIVFATDASFHFAGDGKLGGIIKPNDGKCHLDPAGAYYTHAEILDYPSVAQINTLVKKKVIHIIFAVTGDQMPIYNSLKGSIEGSAVGNLTADSSNVVELVTDEYKKITSTIEMKTTASEEFISVTYYTNCGQPGEMQAKHRCTDIPIGTVVEFNAKIEVLKCPSDQEEWKQQFEIYSVGVTERVVVDLEILCRCDECENIAIPQAEECNRSGTLSCGVCKCDGNNFGDQCQCSDQSGIRDDEEWRCRKDNSSLVCSGKGVCYCGQCECNRREDPRQKISGVFCECDNFGCVHENGLLCSGEDHGTCNCGRCECQRGWIGIACECKTDESTCIMPGDDQKCSGKGACVCGQCECQQSAQNETYSGRFCENCRNCPDECEEIAECVLCKVHNKDKSTDCPDCLRYGSIKEVDFVSDNGTSTEKFCLGTDPVDGCRYYFTYGFSETREIHVKAQLNKDCPPEAPVALIIGGGTGGIVLMGLLCLILWKLFTTIQDRQEYARFQQDKENAKFTSEMNPLYKQATSNYRNPAYAGMNH